VLQRAGKPAETDYMAPSDHPKRDRPKRTRSKRAGIAGLILLILTAICITPLLRASHASAAVPATLSLSEIKDINYMPSDASFANMWSDWDPTQIAADYAKIASFGENTVRVIIPATTFNFPLPSTVMTSRLADIVNMATAAGLHVQLTLFDEFGLYDQTANSKLFIDNLIQPYQNNPEIAFIELQNEIDVTNPTAVAWAQAMMPVLLSDAGTIPVTISTSATAGIAGLTSLKSDLSATPPTFYDYHYYGTAGAAYASLAAAKTVASPLGLIVGEAGDSTAGTDQSELQSGQAAFYDQVDAATADLDLPPAAPWMMFDLTAGGAPVGDTASTLTYGLFDVNGVAKPAASVESNFLATGTIPPVENPGFEDVSNGVPTGWFASHPTAGTMVADPTVSHGGTYSASISATTGTQGAEASWEATANLGAISGGDHVQALTWMKGLNSTGYSAISLSWFDANNNYISNSTSAYLPSGTTNWIQVGVNATAPANAAYAVVNLESYGNSGTVYFDDVSSTNYATAPFPALPVVPATSGVGPTVANPGFETEVNAMPTGWSASHASSGTMAVSSAVSHSGTYSASISATTGTQSSQPDWEATENLGAITTGEHVQTLAWVDGVSSTGYTTVAVSWFTAGNTYLSNTTSSNLPAGTTGWVQLGVNATAPANAAYAVVNLESYDNSGTVYFDDVSSINLGATAFPVAAAVSAVTATVTNPGFETEVSGAPTSWSASRSTSGTMAVSSTVSHSGTYSATIAATTGTQGSQCLWETTPNLGTVVAGEHVQAQVWAEGKSATGYTSLSVSWFNASRVYLSNTTSSYLSTGTTGWAQLTANATAPANATYAVVNLGSYDNSGTVYFDDVTVANLGSAAFPSS
jgi:hypothetical protein